MSSEDGERLVFIQKIIDSLLKQLILTIFRFC